MIQPWTTWRKAMSSPRAAISNSHSFHAGVTGSACARKRDRICRPAGSRSPQYNRRLPFSHSNLPQTVIEFPFPKIASQPGSSAGNVRNVVLFSITTTPTGESVSMLLEPDTHTLWKWSGRRDSNSRRPPWQGGALPTELRPRERGSEHRPPPRPSTAFWRATPATILGPTARQRQWTAALIGMPAASGTLRKQRRRGMPPLRSAVPNWKRRVPRPTLLRPAPSLGRRLCRTDLAGCPAAGLDGASGHSQLGGRGTRLFQFGSAPYLSISRSPSSPLPPPPPAPSPPDSPPPLELFFRPPRPPPA